MDNVNEALSHPTANEIATGMAIWGRAGAIHRAVVGLDDDRIPGTDGHDYCSDNCLVAYGNDGVLELPRVDLAKRGMVEVGFGVDPDGMTRAMIVTCDNDDFLRDLLWDAWNRACVQVGNGSGEAES